MKFDNVSAADFTVDRILSDKPVKFKRYSRGITAVAAFSNRGTGLSKLQTGLHFSNKTSPIQGGTIKPTV